MTNNKRLDAIYLLLLGCAAFLLLGIVMALASPSSALDFKVIYYGSRSAVHHSDPYVRGEILHRYLADGGQLPAGTVQARIARDVLSMCIYPPTALLFMVPLSFLAYGPAHILWLGLLLISFIAASILAWDLAAEFDPMLAAVLAAILVANNIIAVGVGNSAVLVVAFCVVPVWCFVRDRFVWAGVLLLAFAIGTKPHDAIWVWLVLLLADGKLRRRALGCALVLGLLAVPAFLWISHIAPHWPHELGANVAALGAPGASAIRALPQAAIAPSAWLSACRLSSAHLFITRDSTICSAIWFALRSLFFGPGRRFAPADLR